MPTPVQLIFVVLIGGAIGYMTNAIAIRMLFRPHRPRRVLFFRFQGVIPKRKAKIARALGEAIERELLDKETLYDDFVNDETKHAFKTTLKQELAARIEAILPAMFKSILGTNVEHAVDRYIEREGDALIETLFAAMKDKGLDNVDIPSLVETKINAMDTQSFEALILGLVKKELRHIERLGFVLGALIGFVQAIILLS